MNGLFIGLSVVFVISIIIFLIERLKECSVKATVLKATSSLLFVVLACVAVLIKPENSGYGMMFIIGMVLCTIGDIWLDLKYVHKENDEQYTFVGIGSFMISHIFYLVGILMAYPEFIGWQVALAIFSALSVSVIERLISKKTGFEYGKFKTLTFVYSIVIMLTVTFSLNGMNAFGWLPMLGGAEMPDVLPRFVTMNVGTLIFALSDLALSIAFFKKNGNTKANVIWVHITYYLAQYLLALSILIE
jgi:uncharacterized membrane protein YhhN